MTPTVLVLMGVSGSGKTTLGTQLSKRLGWTFKEGDELHPSANIARMRQGSPLTDADRGPWLDAVAAWIDGWISDGIRGVITCSALKRSYRSRLSQGRPAVAFVFLEVREGILAERLAERRDHFMPASLLASQLATVEPPMPDEGVMRLDAGAPLAAQVDAVVRALERCGHHSSREQA